MSPRSFLCALAFAALLAPSVVAQPVKFFGQDPNIAASQSTINTVPANGGAASARNRFLSHLDPATVQTQSFEGFGLDDNGKNTGSFAGPPYDNGTFTPDAASCQGRRAANDPDYAGVPCVRFANREGPRRQGAPAAEPFPITELFTIGSGANAISVTGEGYRIRIDDAPVCSSSNVTTAGHYCNVNNLSAGDPKPDAFPTSGDQFLKGNGELRLDFGGEPVSAWGVYITDTETTDTIVLTVRPDGQGADDSRDVRLEFRGVVNTGNTSETPGDGAVVFVGFIDKDTQYERVALSFEGAQTEGFGFDDFTVGAVAQVTSEQVTVTSAEVFNGPGWRLLSAPVGPTADDQGALVGGTGVTPNGLALINLVQGVTAGDGVSQQQYPDTSPNLLTTYNGGGRFDYELEDEAGAAVATGTALEPGRGFWWYWYDLDINPPDGTSGGGTSESVELTGFYLSAIGDEVTQTVTRAFENNSNSASNSGLPDANPAGPGGAVLPADDDFYMVGNPFADPLDVSSISVTGGTLQQCFFAWDPGTAGTQAPDAPNSTLDGPGSYVVVIPDGSNTDLVAVWQGLMSEVTNAGPTVTYTLDAAGRVPAGTPPFYGRRTPEPRVALALTGVTASGARVRDEAAVVREVEGATVGWDPFDGSKPLPPTPSYALVAPLGERGGEPKRQSVLSLPPGAAASGAEVALSFTANEAGAFEIAATLAGGMGAVLTDHATGAVADLAAGPYAFDATPTHWTDRFTLALSGRAVAADGGPAAEPFVGAPTPNPSAGAARVAVRLAEPGAVRVEVYDVLGRRVASSEGAALAAGVERAVEVPTAGLAPGLYVVRVAGPSVEATRTLTVVR